MEIIHDHVEIQENWKSSVGICFLWECLYPLLGDKMLSAGAMTYYYSST